MVETRNPIGANSIGRCNGFREYICRRPVAECLAGSRVERYTRAGEDVLRYEVTVTDPNTWATPWTAMIPLRSSPDPVFEYACHEANIGMEGIMAGARALEKAEAATGGSR